jgi:hypothetical protein
MTTAASPAPSRAILAVSALWAVACLVFASWNAVRDPMVARKRALDDRLSRISFVEEDLSPSDRAPLKDRRAVIVQKTALWDVLVAPPAAPEARPDLVGLLAGVGVGRQQMMAKGNSIKVRVRSSPEDKQGRWVAVGDTVNGLTIKEIRPDAVVFSIQQNGKEYTAELPRR